MNDLIIESVKWFPVIGVLLWLANYFRKRYEAEQEYNRERDKEMSEILDGLRGFIKEIRDELK
jgi:hypothetical protein